MGEALALAPFWTSRGHRDYFYANMDAILFTRFSPPKNPKPKGFDLHTQLYRGNPGNMLNTNVY